MVPGMVEPLLSMGQTMASFVDDDATVIVQIIEQGCRGLPGQPHQASHAFWGTPIQQQLEILPSQQTIQGLGHPITQGIGDQRAETGGCQLQLIDRIKRALACGVELSQLVQFFPEELQTHRQFTADGKNINDVAATAPGSFLVDR